MEESNSHRREQARLSLVVLAALCLTGLSVALLAHLTPVIHNHVAREVALQRASNGMLLFDNGYLDVGDYVLLGQLPQDDYSRGGVYFVGASEMITGFMPQLLSPGERRLIHNYSIGDLRAREARNFLRMLVAEFALLRAGGDRTTVILGLSYQMGRKKDFNVPPHRYVAELFQRHRLYTYDWNEGVVHRAPLSSIEHFVRIERDYANRFLRILILPPSRARLDVRTDPEKRRHLITIMGDHWREEMRAGVQELAALVDYLQERNVRVRAILPPNGSWQHALPYDAAYRRMVLPVLERRNVPVTDEGAVLADGEFGDTVHARYVGHLKLHRLNRELALHCLAEMGTELESNSSRQLGNPAPAAAR